MNESNRQYERTSGVGLAPRLSVIIVNHEGWPDIVKLTAALCAQPEFRSGCCRIVVVDNASRQPAPLGLSGPRSGLQVIARHHNDGFAAGVNAGWRQAQSPWLLILNPDVDVPRGFLAQVLDRLDHYVVRAEGPPGIVGFGLRNPDGSAQGSVGVFPNLLRTIREQFIPRSRRKYQSACRIHDGPVDWVTGACMLVNSSMIAALGGMDEDFFLYYEEVAFSHAAQRLGWRVEYDASVTVVHRHPLQNRRISPKMRVITRHSKLLYFRKHLPRWQFQSLAAIVRLEALLRGSWAKFAGRRDEARAWQTIGELPRKMRLGTGPRGREVLNLAESAVGHNPAVPAPFVAKGPSAAAVVRRSASNLHGRN